MIRILYPFTLTALCLLAGPLMAAETPEAGGTPLDPLSTGYLAKLTFGLAVVLVSVFVFAWLMRRTSRFQRGYSQHLRILGGLSVGTRERILLVQAGEEQLLVGVAPGRVERLHVMEKPVQPAEEEGGPAPGQSFARRLQEYMDRGRS